MYCTCSNKNNYEVIGLCDVSKFTKKLGPFNNMAWTEITVPAISTLDCNNTNIEAIQKVYVNVSITSTKIIDTPVSASENSEGLFLTGKKLLIDGIVCEKIVYTTLTPTQNINTISFNLPFCTFIVIDANTDVFNDKYCVKYCIEDVFINLIDCKTIFQNITLFLFAQKTMFSCPSIQLPKEDCTLINPPNPIANKLKNSIIIRNNSVTNIEEVAKIEFNKDSEQLMVTSSGIIPDSSSTNTYFSFKIKDSTNQNILYSSNIRSNGDADTFERDLDHKRFGYGNILELNYTHPEKVSITNFPNEGETHIPTVNLEYFRITPEGLIAYNPVNPTVNKLPNSIIINNVSGTPNSPIATIEFDVDNEQFIVTSTGVIPNQSSSSNTFFSLTLKDSNNEIEKVSDSFLNNENANIFQSDLNGESFEFGDILELDYLVPQSILITNYPNASRNYTPNRPKEYYRITNSGLVEYIPIPKPTINKLPNTIIINNRAGGDLGPVVQIEFNSDNRTLIVTSTGRIPDSLVDSKIYFSLSLRDSNNSIIKNSYNILSNENGEKFKNILNEQAFQYEDILKIYYEVPSKGTITNFPIRGNDYTPNNKTEFYKITPQGLTAYTPTPTEINIINRIVVQGESGTVASVTFDSNTKQLIVTSNANIPSPSIEDTVYFSFKLKDDSNRTVKEIATILTDKSSESLKNILNGKKFEIDDILELDYFKPSKIFITDYPEKGKRYIPNINKEYYRITAKGLVPYTPSIPGPSPTSVTLPNEIIIKSIDGEESSRILFDITQNLFFVKTTYKTPYAKAGNQDYVILKLKEENTQVTRKVATLISNTNGEDFFNELNNSPFSIGNFLEMTYFLPKQIQITNYPNRSQTYTPTKQREYYKITATGLTPYTPPTPVIPPTVTTLPNTIKIKATNGSNLAVIQFDSGNMRFVITTTNEIPNYSEGIKEYFTLKLRDGLNKKVKNYSFITANSDSRNLGYDFNNLPFKIGDILELYYLQPNSIEISDIPTGQTHIPTNNKESYTITNTGLQKITNSSNLPISNIVVNSKTDNEVVSIQLQSNNKFIASATGEIPDTNPQTVNKEYFSILSQKNSGLINFTTKFNSGEIADTFASEVTNKPFNDLDFVSLSYAEKSKIEISNFKDESTYIPSRNNEQFIIDNRPIQSNNFRLLNTMMLINVNDEVIATIQFNTISKKLIVLSTNISTTDGDFWTIGLLDSFRNSLKSFTLKQNLKGDTFANEFNGLDFEYGYYIIIGVYNRTLSSLTVTNFENKIINKLPPLQTDISFYSFSITSSGLIRVVI